MHKLNKFSLLLVILFPSCLNNTVVNVSYKGVVYSKYGYPLPNMEIQIFQGSSQKTTKEVGTGFSVTDGSFDITAKVVGDSPCYLNVVKNDSGIIDHVAVSIKGEAGLSIYLRKE